MGVLVAVVGGSVAHFEEGWHHDMLEGSVFCGGVGCHF